MCVIFVFSGERLRPRGLWLSAERCSVGDVYNLGGDQIYSIHQVIETIQAHVQVTFAVQQDPVLVRGCDEPVIAGDISKFRSCSAWSTEIDLAKTVRDMLDWWRDRLGSTSTSAGLMLDSRPQELPAR